VDWFAFVFRKLLVFPWVLFFVELVLSGKVLLLSTWYLPLQLMYLKLCRHSFPFFVLSLGRFVLKFALQYYDRSIWFFTLWGLLHLMYLDLCKWYANIVWPYLQQFLHCSMPGFMFVFLMVAMWLSMLKHLLINLLALEPLWVS